MQQNPCRLISYIQPAQNKELVTALQDKKMTVLGKKPVSLPGHISLSEEPPLAGGEFSTIPTYEEGCSHCQSFDLHT